MNFLNTNVCFSVILPVTACTLSLSKTYNYLRLLLCSIFVAHNILALGVAIIIFVCNDKGQLNVN